MIPPQSHIGAGPDLCSPLPNQNISRQHKLTTKTLHPKAFAFGVTTIPRTTTCFFGCHNILLNILNTLVFSKKIQILLPANAINSQDSHRLPVSVLSAKILAATLPKDENGRSSLLFHDTGGYHGAIDQRRADGYATVIVQ
jgi:hypothetical protein